MIHIEKVDDHIHAQIKDCVFSLAGSLRWKPRYYPRSDVLIADMTANGTSLNVPILEETIVDVYYSLYNTPIKENMWWINKYLSRSFQESHIHEDNNITLSWNYFLHLPKNSGSFVAGNTTLGDNMEGYIIFFPCTLVHEVTPNNSNDIRYTISGNIVA